MELGEKMVVVCKISENGKLIKIKEIPDIYRYKEFEWDDSS
jgi:hypothetical protein